MWFSDWLSFSFLCIGSCLSSTALFKNQNWKSKNTEEYQKLVEKLSNYLHTDDKNNKRIYVPDVYFVKDGKIIGHNNDTSTIEGTDTEEYYTDTAKKDLKEKLTKLVVEVYPKEVCDDTKGC